MRTSGVCIFLPDFPCVTYRMPSSSGFLLLLFSFVSFLDVLDYFLKILKIDPPLYPEISLINIYVQNSKTRFLKAICTHMYCNAIYISQVMERTQVSSGRRVDKDVVHTHTHTEEYCLTVEEDEILPFTTIRIEM